MSQNLLSLKAIIKNILLTEAPIDVWKNKNQSFSSEQLSQAESYFAELTGKYNAVLHPTAKDLTNLNFEQLETLYKAIEIAKNKNLKAPYVQWLTKQLKQQNLNLQQVIEDYIPPLLSLQKNKEKFEPNFLENLQTIQQLNQTLNQKISSDDLAVSEQELGKLAEENGWILYMPHSTEASCEIGKTGGRRDTTWCTTRPDASNLFLQYSATPDKSIILFYVIRKGINAETDPFAKMSVGFVDGKPKFNQGDGGVSVNANNKNVTQQKFEEVLGKDLASKFLQIMQQKATSLKGEHPAKDEFRKLVQNPKAFQSRIDSFAKDENGQELRKNFIESSLGYKEISPEVLTALARDKDADIRSNVAGNSSTPPEVLTALARDKDEFVRSNVAENPNTPPEALTVLARDKDVRRGVAGNSSTPPEVLTALARDEDISVRRIVAGNSSTPPEVLTALARDKDVRRNVAKNPSTPPEVLTALARDEVGSVRLGVAQNPWTPPEALTALARDKDVIVRSNVAENPNTPPEVLTALARNEVGSVRLGVAQNPSTPPEVLTALARDKDVIVRERVAKNPSTPPEALTALARDIDEFVRRNVAENPNTPPEVLTALARDKVADVRDAAAKTLANLKSKQLAESIIIEKVWKKLSKLI
jgi:3-methyladenine DNA glycosylase AlkC